MQGPFFLNQFLQKILVESRIILYNWFYAEQKQSFINKSYKREDKQLNQEKMKSETKLT